MVLDEKVAMILVKLGHLAVQRDREAYLKELVALARFLAAAVNRMNQGGCLAVISYHSLEDRIVKEAFRKDSGVCLCPPRLPACVCGARKALEVLTRRPIRPSQLEVDRNPRSRSARLRAAEKVEPPEAVAV